MYVWLYLHVYQGIFILEIAPSWCDCDKAPKVEMAVGVCREVFSRDEVICEGFNSN